MSSAARRADSCARSTCFGSYSFATRSDLSVPGDTVRTCQMLPKRSGGPGHARGADRRRRTPMSRTCTAEHANSRRTARRANEHSIRPHSGLRANIADPVAQPPRPIASYTRVEVLARPGRLAVRRRRHHIETLASLAPAADRPGGRCEIRRPGCTGRATEADHGVPRCAGRRFGHAARVLSHVQRRRMAPTMRTGHSGRPARSTTSRRPVRRCCAGSTITTRLSASLRPKSDRRTTGRPDSSSRSIDDVAIWRRFNSPDVPYPLPARAARPRVEHGATAPVRRRRRSGRGPRPTGCPAQRRPRPGP